jgi:hypothetical protein
MAGGTALDQALVALLDGDATLKALLPDGVHFDVAPPNAIRCVVLSLVDHLDVYVFDEVSHEQAGYAVVAVTQDTSGDTAEAAADQIHALLQDGALTVDGFELMRLKRRGRLRRTVPDENSDQRWQQRGGTYEIWITPA